MKYLFAFILLIFYFSSFSQILDCSETATTFFDIRVHSTLYKHDNLLYFFGENDANGVELWVSDGTESGTYMLKDICSGFCSSYGLYSFSKPFLSYKGNLFFVAKDDVVPTLGKGKLWMTDGTPQGTKLVKDLGFNSSGIKLRGVFFDKIFFEHNEDLAISDGTETGTQIFSNIDGDSEMIEFKRKIYFAGNDGGLWETNGTSDGTRKIKDIEITSNFYVLNDRLLFYADDGLTGEELWVSDGTTGGTELLLDINLNSSSSNLFFGKEFQGKLYFGGDDGNFGKELWATDGTVAGTKMIKDIYRGAESSNPRYLTVFREKLFFQAGDFDSGLELWESDGTEDGTSLFQDLNLDGDFEPFGVHPNNSSLLDLEYLNEGEKLFLSGKERRSSGFYMLNEDDSICKLSSQEASYATILNGKMYLTNLFAPAIRVVNLPFISKASDKPENGETIHVFPNPANHSCTLEFPNEDFKIEKLYASNSIGNVINLFSNFSIFNEQVIIDVSSLKSGFYTLTVKTTSSSRSKKLLIIRE